MGWGTKDPSTPYNSMRLSRVVLNDRPPQKGKGRKKKTFVVCTGCCVGAGRVVKGGSRRTRINDDESGFGGGGLPKVVRRRENGTGDSKGGRQEDTAAKESEERAQARGVGNGALHLLAQTEGGRVVQYVQGSGESWKRNGLLNLLEKESRRSVSQGARADRCPD